MNKERRRNVNIARNTIARAKDMLVDANKLLDRTADEEQDALDNTPEAFQDTDRYYDSEQAADTLSESVASLDDIIDALRNII